MFNYDTAQTHMCALCCPRIQCLRPRGRMVTCDMSHFLIGVSRVIVMNLVCWKVHRGLLTQNGLSSRGPDLPGLQTPNSPYMGISQSPGSLHRGTQEVTHTECTKWRDRSADKVTLSHTPPQSLEGVLTFYGGKQTIGVNIGPFPTTNQKGVTLSVSGLTGSITVFHLVQINSGKTGEHKI